MKFILKSLLLAVLTSATVLPAQTPYFQQDLEYDIRVRLNDLEHVLTGNLELAKYIGLKASRRFVLYNGAIECRLLKYELY